MWIWTTLMELSDEHTLPFKYYQVIKITTFYHLSTFMSLGEKKYNQQISPSLGLSSVIWFIWDFLELLNVFNLQTYWPWSFHGFMHYYFLQV